MKIPKKSNISTSFGIKLNRKTVGNKFDLCSLIQISSIKIYLMTVEIPIEAVFCLSIINSAIKPVNL